MMSVVIGEQSTMVLEQRVEAVVVVVVFSGSIWVLLWEIEYNFNYERSKEENKTNNNNG